MMPLIVAIVGSHVAWSLHLMVSYFFVSLLCQTGSTLYWALLHVVTAIALAVIAASGLVAYRAWRVIKHQLEDVSGTVFSETEEVVVSVAEGQTTKGTPPESALRRTRILAVSGLGLCILYAFLIVLSEVSNFLVAPCT